MGEEQKVRRAQGTSNRGFASMDEKRQKEIASKGGKIAHERGHAHEFNSEEARIAGRKGGQASHSSRLAEAEKAKIAAEAPQKLDGDAVAELKMFPKPRKVDLQSLERIAQEDKLEGVHS